LPRLVFRLWAVADLTEQHSSVDRVHATGDNAVQLQVAAVGQPVFSVQDAAFFTAVLGTFADGPLNDNLTHFFPS
jgi:hypothetical protein